MDFSAHNEEVRKVWDAYWAGKPFRAPVTFSLGIGMVLFDPALNTKNYTARQYYENPDIMWEMQLALQKWMRLEVPRDVEMGLPGQWDMWSDFATTYDATWFGAPMTMNDHDIVETTPIFDKHKEKLYDTPLPTDHLRGYNQGKMLEYYDYFESKRKKEDFMGRPVGPTQVPLWTCGPFTAACSLRGATEACEDMLEDEKYFHDLMEYITRGTLLRIKAWRKYTGFQPYTASDEPFFADDSIAMLSPGLYQEHVLPFQKRIVEELIPGCRPMMHLCGKAQHQFAAAAKALGVKLFEVGFPTDMGRARAELGEAIALKGNISPMLLRSGTPQAVDEAVKRLCEGGVMRGGAFILQDGNSCAPCTPLENLAAMYAAGKKYAKYS